MQNAGRIFGKKTITEVNYGIFSFGIILRDLNECGVCGYCRIPPYITITHVVIGKDANFAACIRLEN